MKHIAKTARENMGLLADGQVVILAYYIDSKNPDPLAGSLEGIVRALLWQLLRQDSRYFEFVLPHFEDMKRSRPTFEWKSSVLQSMLSEVLSHSDSQSFWIFLDGLDEYSGDLLDMADILNQWISMCSEKVRICFSSRPEQELLLSINSSVSTLKLEEHTQGDITICATQEIQRVSSLLGSDCCKHLIKCISTQANGLFMWVRLASRDIVRTCMKGTAIDHKQLLARLDHLPTEVNDLYLQILQRRTDPADYNEALVMLGIVAFGQRSFTLREFYFVLQSIDIENSNYSNYENSLMIRRIDSRTGGLLDYQSGRVVFSHGTVSTFVHHLLDQESQSAILCGAYKRLSQACLNLLWTFEPSSTTQVRHLPFRLEEHHGIRLQDLRKYAIQHWIYHTTCAAIKNMYDSRTARPPLIRNDQFVHWQRSYLAQCWEYGATTAPRSSNPITSTLACLLLTVIPLSVFSPEYRMTSNDKFNVLSLDPPQSLQHRLGSAAEWKNANLNFLITIEFAAEYTVSFHAYDILNRSMDVMNCIISPLNGANQSFEQQCNRFHNILQSSPISRSFADPITIRQCTVADFNDIPIPKKNISVPSELLDQIRVVLWHYIQTEAIKAQDPELSINRQAPTPDGKQDDAMSFATPIHYAAFFGLDLVVEALHRYGADITHFSEESRYGSPLIAAIWGISKRRSGMDHIIESILKLDKTRKNMVTPANAGHLGKVTPLNAAVKLYTSYRRRTGLGSEDLRETIFLLIDEESVVDLGTRVIIRANPELGRYFATVTKPTFTASASGLGSSAAIAITSPRSLRSLGSRGNASIAGFGNTNISGLMPYGHGPGGPRIIQTLEERF
ncbi:hypothetical protein HD806DRAFT_522416 [Xylariaceae sp. AK1471]|nr:hypothetical protein HD806DRAFT_522416 [Xylariaceae sp. AK1471]